MVEKFDSKGLGSLAKEIDRITNSPEPEDLTGLQKGLARLAKEFPPITSPFSLYDRMAW